ncbi:unnamed protein product [Parnassius apollo]|uniref:(apollo) hypothetical protein n=1 Tax=Parnassius apollo TaxID=110799 RepID=A0A8S3Y725_PARAO|nr:unnamed protein product [Parnassius apollo]
MRTLLVAVVFCALQTYCLGNIGNVAPLEDSRFLARAYPKQKRIPVHRNIQILNAQRFIKSLPVENYRLNTKKRYIETREGYTVFPAIPIKKIPESPFFPLESFFDQKANRVYKKMLPDYGLLNLSRRKRSANSASSTNPEIHHTTKNINTNEKEKKGEKDMPARRQNSRTVKIERKVPIDREAKVVVTPKTRPSKVVKKIKNGDKSSMRQKDVNLRSKVTGSSEKKNRSKNKNPKSRPRKRNNNDRKQKNKQNDKKRSGNGGQFQKVDKSRRLIAGKDAKIDDYPYVVSIQKDNEHWCAGALLNPRLVITTANCVWKSERVSRLKIRAGSRYADRGGQTAGIQEMMRHPLWSLRRNPDHDVALLLLDKNIQFSDRVHSVDLPNRVMMPTFEDAWVTSWGTDRPDGIFENKELTLQAYHAHLMDHEKCNNITKRYGLTVTRNFICLSQNGKRAPCTRDTGAPAVSDGVVWGLASWGIRKLCGTERIPAMFSYLASNSNMNFIINATHLLMADERFYPFPDRFRDSRFKAMIASTKMVT